jgi:uncharacterized protein YjbJ (UPF0337 family)
VKARPCRLIGEDAAPVKPRSWSETFQKSPLKLPDLVELRPHRGTVISARARTRGEGHRLSILNPRETTMNWDRIQLDWMIFKDKVRGNWVKLTDEDVTRIGGRRDQLIGRLQARYGFAKSEAAREVEAWLRSQKRAA